MLAASVILSPVVARSSTSVLSFSVSLRLMQLPFRTLMTSPMSGHSLSRYLTLTWPTPFSGFTGHSPSS